MAETSAHILRHWDGGNPDDVWRSTVGFGQFRAVIESVGEQFGSWCVALELAGFAAEGVDELLAGLVLGLLPIDPAAAAHPLRVDAGFVVKAQPTLPQALEAAGFGRPTVHVVCTSAPTRWQRVAMMAALSSFTSRSFLLIHVEGSGGLSARVGRLAMEEFPHVTVARIEDATGS